MGTAAADPPRLGCRLEAEPPLLLGGPVRVRLTLTNDGREPLHALTWNTPFEEVWLGTPFAVLRAGTELPYAGGMAKRADPVAEDYLTIAPGASATTVADLAEAYPLDGPGTYEVRVVGNLIDVVVGAATLPRPREAHRSLPLDCAPLGFELAAR